MDDVNGNSTYETGSAFGRNKAIALFLFFFALISLASITGFAINQNKKFALPSKADEVTSYLQYYIDSKNGSDSNSGSLEAPWKTFAPLRNRTLLPGNIVNLKKGSTWTTGLKITNSGTEGTPIVFQTYGDGENPIIENPGNNDNWTSGVEILANWVTVRNVMVKNTYYGFKIGDSNDSSIGTHNVVENNEITNSGFGVALFGEYNQVSGNKIHDLVMAVNTPKDVNSNDDTGASAVHIYNSNNVISYNLISHCKATSYDYGEDGGGIEIYASRRPVNNNYVHHNWVNDSNEFMEIGGNEGSNQTAYDNVFAYNVSINNKGLGYIHLRGGSSGYAVDVRNFKFENNTVVEDLEEGNWAVFGFSNQPSTGTFSFINNIVYVKNYPRLSNYGTFTHENNLYYWIGATTDLGFSKSNSEIVGSNPLFVDPGSARNFKLQQNSPAIDKGMAVGFTSDFDNNTVPSGSAPDIGAYEYTSGSTPPTSYPSSPTPKPTSTSTPTPKPSSTSTPTPKPTSTPTQSPKPSSTPTLTPTPSDSTPTIFYPTPTPTDSSLCVACNSYFRIVKTRTFFRRYYARITWSGVDNADGYYIYKCIGKYCTPDTLIAKVGSSTEQYTDTNSRWGYKKYSSVTYSVVPFKDNCEVPSCPAASITF